jgi:hypothetical protein
LNIEWANCRILRKVIALMIDKRILKIDENFLYMLALVEKKDKMFEGFLFMICLLSLGLAFLGYSSEEIENY